MKVIKICSECYNDCSLLVEEGDVIVIVNEFDCEMDNCESKKEKEE